MSAKAENLEGNKYGQWTVLHRDPIKYKRPKWICICSCGSIRSVYAHSLKGGGSKCCGCIKPDQKTRPPRVIKQPCAAPNCPIIPRSGKYCSRHAEQIRIHGRLININPLIKRSDYKINDNNTVSLFLYNKWREKTGEAIIDYDDLDRCKDYLWSMTNGYATRHKNGKTIYLHRQLLEAPTDKNVDHINGAVLDNRKANLRLCSQKENMWNSKLPKHNTSGHKGVCYNTSRNTWVAQISINNVTTRIGSFKNKEDAIAAYTKRAKELRGEFYRAA